MLDKIESDVRNDIENNLQDSDTDYIVDKSIPENKEESHQLLTPEAAVHFDGYVFYMDEPPAKKLKKEVVELKWKGTSKLVKMKKVHTRIKHIIRHSRKLQPIADLKIQNSIFNSETYVRQSNLYATENGRQFATNPEVIRLSVMSCRFQSYQT